MEKTKRSRPGHDFARRRVVGRRFVRAIALAGLGTGLVLTPPVARHVLALGDPPADDRLTHWVLALAILGASSLLVVPRAPPIRLAMVFTSCLIMLWFELGFRVFARTSMSESERTSLALHQACVKPDYRANFGVGYTNNPANEGVNSLGFLGPEFIYEKPTNTVRVACLGGSTSLGYPTELETWFADHRLSCGARFEVLNFAVGGWNTANSLANFVLNVVDFSPDYVVVHHAWNDHDPRRRPCEQRGDYSHATLPFSWFEIPPSRCFLYRSALFAYLVRIWSHRQSETFLGGQPSPYLHSVPCEELDPIWPYRRNINTFVDLASARGSVVVLASQPHSVDPEKNEGRTHTYDPCLSG